jgi:hypothetical protein
MRDSGGRQAPRIKRSASKLGKMRQGQAPRIKLNASKPSKIRQIRDSRALLSARRPTSKVPIAGSRVVRIMDRTRNRVVRITGKIRSRVAKIMGRMRNRVARILQIITQIPTDPLAPMVPGTAAPQPVLGAATTPDWQLSARLAWRWVQRSPAFRRNRRRS